MQPSNGIFWNISPVEEIYKLRDRLERELSFRFGTIYNGYLGVDMMICRFPESPVYRIHPCVEINSADEYGGGGMALDGSLFWLRMRKEFFGLIIIL